MAEEEKSKSSSSSSSPSATKKMMTPIMISCFHRLRRMALLFELLFLASLLSWLSFRLPFAVRLSASFLRSLAGVVVSPLFVFALANAIVLTLIVKSGHSSSSNNKDDEIAPPPLFASLEDPDEKMAMISDPDLETESVVVFEDKEMIFSKKDNATAVTAASDDDALLNCVKSESLLLMTPPQSENLMAEKRSSLSSPAAAADEKMLQRLETEVMSGEESSVVGPEEDGMSSEEFQRIIEAFIAKQKRFRREELMQATNAIVVHGQA